MSRRPNPFVDSAVTPPHTWRVLHVEDTLTVRETVRVFLQPMGYLIDEAENALAALARVHRQKYDLIICDYLLGTGPDGQSLLDKLRRENLIPRSTAFFMLTTERNYNRVAQVVELTPDAYMLKPFTLQELENRLRAQLDRISTLRPILDAMDEGAWATALDIARGFDYRSLPMRREGQRLAVECMVKLGRIEAAKAHVEKVCEEQRPAPRWAMWERARLALLTESKAEARFRLTRFHDSFPHFVPAIDALCEMALEEGDLVSGHLWATRAVSISATAERLRRLGLVEGDLGNTQAAEDAFTRAAERGRTSFFGDAVDYALAADAALASGDRHSRKRAARLSGEGRASGAQSPMAKVLLPLVAAGASDKTPRPASDREVVGKELDALLQGPGLDPRVALVCAGQLLQQGYRDGAVQLLERVQQTCRLDRGLELRVTALLEQADPARRPQRTVRAGDTTQGARPPIARSGPTEHTEGPSRQTGARSVAPDDSDDESARAIEKNNAAVKLLREGSLERAITLLNDAVAEMPGHTVLRTNLVKALVRRYDRDGDPLSLEDAAEVIEEGRRHGVAEDVLDQLTLALADRRRSAAAETMAEAGRVAKRPGLARLFGRR